jgi:predicted methyltransferase
MTRQWFFAVLASVTLATAAAAAPVPGYIKTAVADSKRPAADTDRDVNRKPAEMLVFAGVKPGMKVMDLMAEGGYFTRLFSPAVGSNGWVYAFQPNEWDAYLKGKTPPIYAVAADYKNVSVIKQPINNLSAPEALDLVWTSQNYHDMKNKMMTPADTALVNKAIFNALKPGGLYVVLDHSAPKGSGTTDTETLHRIDEDVVKKEVLAAGFKFVGESKLLSNPADPRDKIVFDKSIRGHTDQFILKFRKPAK